MGYSFWIWLVVSSYVSSVSSVLRAYESKISLKISVLNLRNTAVKHNNWSCYQFKENARYCKKNIT